MAIGVAFASLFNNPDMSILISSIMLAFGIGIQNFPLGAKYKHSQNPIK